MVYLPGQKGGFVIIVDTREQKPWRFRSKTTKRKLDFGDYSVEGQEFLIQIERKGSLSDLYLSLGKHHKRFMEKMRLAAKQVIYPFLIIEASLSEVSIGFERSSISPSVIISSLIDLMREGVYVIFVGKTRRTSLFVENLLKRIVQKELEELGERQV